MRNILRTVLIGGSLLLAGFLSAKAQEQSQVVAFAAVPAAVQKTITTEVEHAKSKLGEINKNTDGSEISYEVELTKPRAQRTVTIGPDGGIISREVFMRELPEAAKKAVRAQVTAAQAKLENIELVMDEGTVTYEVDMTKGERDISFTVNEEGKLLALEVLFAETPAPVQKTILAKSAGGVVKSIYKNLQDEDGEISYDVDVMQGGKKVSISITAAGELIEE